MHAKGAHKSGRYQDMTTTERQQSLINARKACEWLRRVAPAFDAQPRAEVECLLLEFERLDAKEQTQINAGRKYGKLGKQYGNEPPKPGKKQRGRPRKESK